MVQELFAATLPVVPVGQVPPAAPFGRENPVPLTTMLTLFKVAEPLSRVRVCVTVPLTGTLPKDSEVGETLADVEPVPWNSIAPTSKTVGLLGSGRGFPKISVVG
jgi:hypothetical protein